MTVATRIGPPHDSGEQLLRTQQLDRARREGWPELDRKELAFRRFGIVEHVPTGDLYRVHRGELVDAIYVAAAAYYFTEGRELVFLEAAA